MTLKPAFAVILATMACVPALGAAPEPELSSIVVTATRMPQSSWDLPVSIDRIDRPALAQGQLQVNLSESLDQIPGVQAQNRQNYAQDLQLSVRGFGARSSFGVRGVRLYADGIPGTMPDGQGQFSHFDLSSADHIEVLRGPFSALYGNSSGGVIAIFTQDGEPGTQLQAQALGGSFGTQRYSARAGGAGGALNYLVQASHFHTDGYRDHSEAERNSVNGKLRWDIDEKSKLTLIANAIQTPDIQDPLGLDRTQLAADPTQAGTNALLYNTRKSLSQEQLGAIYERSFSPNDDFSTTVYAGHRATTQYQAILKSAEAPLTHPGGVIDLTRTYSGIDAHLSDHRDAGGGPLQTTIGMSYDNLDEDRLGFLNFVGNQLGVEGALRRDEANRVYDFDQYLQVQWDPEVHWRAMAGVRHSVVDVTSHNHLADQATTGVRYSATNPVAGLTFRASEHLNVYASYGKGFETPTLNDLAYRSTNGSLPGLNLALQPTRSNNYELGLKADAGQYHATLAAFRIDTSNELAVQSNSGGRSVFQNTGATRRTGAELGIDAQWNPTWSGRLAYTYLKAVTTEAYTSCVGIPCLPIVIPSGNRIPALPANSLYAALNWRYAPAGFFVGAETVGRAKIYADDRNSDAAAGYWSTNLKIGLEQSGKTWRVGEFARIDNIADRRYVGSVIVNESNSRFFEPEPGRALYVGVSAAYRRQ